MTRALLLLGGLLALAAIVPVYASGSVGIHIYTQETEGGHGASAGASITYTHATAGTPGSQAGAPSGGAPGTQGPAPVAAVESPPAATAVSSGESSGSAGSGRLHGKGCPALNYPPPCLLPASTSPPAPAGSARPPVNPAVLAASVAERLSLSAGSVQASPSARMAGLTGAASWFWLSPSPSPRSLSVSLGGESVSVTASAGRVQWAFGDGGELSGGPGVPYRPGGVPAGAVLHTYTTRCLPGDRGHDPYVLSSCGAQGYRVQASVVWDVSYRASGRVSGSGALPSRSTFTSIVYPVSEARAFLTSGAGAGAG